jgi:hypothetical protein
MRGFDHHRRAARVYLVPGHIRKILHNGSMDEPAAPCPIVLGKSIRNDRNERQIVVVTLPLARELAQVNILRPAPQ